MISDLVRWVLSVCDLISVCLCQCVCQKRLRGGLRERKGKRNLVFFFGEGGHIFGGGEHREVFEREKKRRCYQRMRRKENLILLQCWKEMTD